jgi:hypothetical protein
MASYTDSIPQFNPFVQQLPVEAMVQVGMQKQKQYDEGIQKIQTSIDNIAGLDVANDADKAYLQSKLNQLGNDLTIVAGGDFSNFQLVNSVSGMTNQIIKDPNVKNAVYSTAHLRKEQARKEKAIQEGKSSPENEWWFNNEVNGYLQSTTPGQTFNGQYIEYKDVDKKLRGLATDLQKAGFEKSVDNPFKRDAATGKTLYYNKDGSVSTDPSKGGTPRIATSMLRTTVKGIGAEKILNNFYDSLDEGDKRQLNITAQYHYKDSTPITFQNDIIKTYNEKKKLYSDAIVDASVKLATGDYTPEEKIILQNQINKAKELVYDGGLDKQMNEDMAGVDTEAEASAYKYKIYTQKYLTNLAKDLSNESYSTEYTDKLREIFKHNYNIIDFLYKVFDCGLYMRGWKVTNENYPLKESLTLYDKLEGALQRIETNVYNSINEVFERVKLYREDEIKVLENLPLMKISMEKDKFSYIISPDPDDGKSILDRLRIVLNGDKHKNMKSCIRLTSNIILISIHYYLCSLGIHEPFSLNELDHIT